MVLIPSQALTRRKLLAGLAGGVALAPFLPVLQSQAAVEGAPKRFLVLNTFHGLAYDNWRVSGTETNWKLSPILTPLAKFKDRLLVVEGLANEAGKASKLGHNSARRTILTGAKMSSNGKQGGPSIDQVVAQANSSGLPIHSLYSSVFPTQNLVAKAKDETITGEINPTEVFDKLFANVGNDEATLSKLKQDRKTVLDAVHQNLKALHTKVSTEDRQKIERHLEGIQKMESAVANLGQLPDNCTVPTQPEKLNPAVVENYPELVELHSDLIVSAFACDLTRTAVLDLGGSSQTIFKFLGMNTDIHQIAHEGSQPGKPRYAEFTKVCQYYAQVLNDLMTKLDAVQEGSGTMLDNTLIVWSTFMANGSHTADNMPFTLAGGLNGQVKMGRYLKAPGRAQNDLWLSVANAMGAGLTTFGDPQWSQGGLPGFA